MSSLNSFLYCFYGQSGTEYYLSFADLLYKLKWYELPINLQTYICFMIQMAHKPLYYHGFNIAYLNLAKFTTVNEIYFN